MLSLVAVVVAVSVAVLVIVGAVILLILRRRRRNEGEGEGEAAVSSSMDHNSRVSNAIPKKGRGRESSSSSVASSEGSHRSQVSSHSRKGDSMKLSFVRDDREHFDLQELLRASAEILGSGCFSSSYKANLLNGPTMVVKRFKQMNNVGREEFHEHMRRIARLSHPNLLPLVAYYYRKEEKLLITDFVHNGSLAVRLHGISISIIYIYILISLTEQAAGFNIICDCSL
jgi:hypothetical protein